MPLAVNAQGLRLVRDAEIETSLKQWAEPVFQAAGLSGEQVNLVLVDSPNVNAFVAGGANLFVFSGLFLKAQSAEEIVGVIAHEMGHMAAGHLIGSRMAMERTSFETILASVLGIGVGLATGNAGAGMGVAQGGSAVAASGFFAHSRLQESSADQAGLRFMKQAEYDQRAMVTFMQKLADAEALPDGFKSGYGQTHPALKDRVETLKASINQQPTSTRQQALPQEAFALVKAKIMGFTAPDTVAYTYDLKDTSSAALYARSIAAYRRARMGEALEHIETLLARDPTNPYFHEMKGQVLQESGKLDLAIQAYRKALDLRPQQPLLQMALAEALLASVRVGAPATRLNKAETLLNQARVREARSAHIFRLLGVIKGLQNQKPDMHAYLAYEALLEGRSADARVLASRAKAASGISKAALALARDVLTAVEPETGKQR